MFYSLMLGCNVAISRKRHCNKGAFLQIPTAPNLYVYLAVVSIEAIDNSVPRDDIVCTFTSLDLLQIDDFY